MMISEIFQIVPFFNSSSVWLTFYMMILMIFEMFCLRYYLSICARHHRHCSGHPTCAWSRSGALHGEVGGNVSPLLRGAFRFASLLFTWFFNDIKKIGLNQTRCLNAVQNLAFCVDHLFQHCQNAGFVSGRVREYQGRIIRPSW